MKMKVKILLMLALFLSGGAFAQNSARSLLKKTLDKMSSYKNFEAGLSYSMDNEANNIHEKKTGVIYVEGDKFRIELMGQIIISDGKNMWTVIKDSKEVMLSALDPDDPSNVSPTKILQEYSDYNAKFEKGKSKGNLKTLVLTSKKKAAFEKVTIVIDAAKHLVKRFSLYDEDGNVFTYDIYNFKSNLDLPKGTFAYDPKEFPGYELEDMR